MKKTEEEQLVEELCWRFEKKPRKCKKINDSGIGNSERIVCIFNDTFFYYPKIQQFNDLDFYKLQYILPKAGVKLHEILQLKFPPRRNNQRNYFSITLPKNKILKYTKKNEELIIDEEAEGQQTWTFYFDYDIISLPQIERRREIAIERQKIKKEKQLIEELEQLKKREEDTEKKLQEEYEALLQAQRLEKENVQYNEKKKQLYKQEQREKMLKEADELNFHYLYKKALTEVLSEYDYLMVEMNLLEAIGKFRKRADQIVRDYIDEMAYAEKPFKLNVSFQRENLVLKIDFDKSLNQQYLANVEVAHTIYAIRKKIRPETRVPLHAFIKYKGFKVMARAVTPIDLYKSAEKESMILHGICQENWKTHFFILDDLNEITQEQNLKPYTSQVQFQNVVLHLGTSLQIIETKIDPFSFIKQLQPENFQQNTDYRINYMFNINEVFPIDLDLQKNINQSNIRLRPEFVKNFFVIEKEEKIKLSAGGLMYSLDDDEGEKQDILLAKASQCLKYITLSQFVSDMDKLKYLPLNSKELGKILKQHGINLRYIGNIYKLTTLPYLREMVGIQAISRQIKKAYRNHQNEYYESGFKKAYSGMVAQAYGKDTTRSLRTITLRKLKQIQSTQSINNAIDYLNLVFGNSHETEKFWEIIATQVYDNYKIPIKNYMDLSHGYLLTTVCEQCGFEIKLDSSIILFSNHDPFKPRDWIKFTSKISSFTYPSMQLYNKVKITPNMSQQKIKNALELQLCMKRALGENDDEVLVQLAKYLPQIEAPSKKYSIQSLKYYVQNPTIEKFETAFEICQFILPPSHPYFLELYQSYSKIPDFDPITLKRTAQNHAIRNLGITHSKTSSILSNFKEDEYLKHLIEAEKGVERKEKMSLYRKIVEEQARIGKFHDCYLYTLRAISYSEERKSLLDYQVGEYFALIMIGIEVTYKSRKISDMLKISEYLWNGIEYYCQNENCSKIIYHLLYYCLKGCLESLKTKYYLFKLVMVVREHMTDEEMNQKEEKLLKLRKFCREAKNHLSFINQVVGQLQFGYNALNNTNNFFLAFERKVRQLNSDEFQEGLGWLRMLIALFDIGYFEEALLEKSYAFEKLTFSLAKK